DVVDDADRAGADEVASDADGAIAGVCGTGRSRILLVDGEAHSDAAEGDARGGDIDDGSVIVDVSLNSGDSGAAGGDQDQVRLID
ncbi:hypothetical protein DKP78_22135, partial [Enterococcus faecium]